MNRLVFAPFAEADLDEVMTFLDSLPDAPALRLARDIEFSLQYVTTYPNLSQADSQLSSYFGRSIHRRVCRDYVIFYTFRQDDEVEVIAILHGKRDTEQILRDRYE